MYADVGSGEGADREIYLVGSCLVVLATGVDHCRGLHCKRRDCE